jgi:chorismate mutase/prephenate dehydratase
MADLEFHRQKIDELDEQIIQALNERTRHALAIGEIKLAQGEEIYAPHRELAVLDKVCRANPGPVPNESLRAIYREIMSTSLALEKTMTIAYLGPEATFTHQAAMKRFGASLKYSAQKTIADVFNEVAHHRADYGVVPIENSTEGVVTHTLDMFIDSDLKIVAQIVMPIEHCLVGRIPKSEIEVLHTHPQALAQCRGWIMRNLPHAEVIEASSTTRAAQKAADSPHTAAIASALAAETYGLEIIEASLQDNPDNVTRFFVLGRKCSPPTPNARTSLMFSLRHEVGALHTALKIFQKHELNLTKIESRPSKRKAWEYIFFVDFVGHFETSPTSDAIDELQGCCNFVKILGSYPVEA